VVANFFRSIMAVLPSEGEGQKWSGMDLDEAKNEASAVLAKAFEFRRAERFAEAADAFKEASLVGCGMACYELGRACFLGELGLVPSSAQDWWLLGRSYGHEACMLELVLDDSNLAFELPTVNDLHDPYAQGLCYQFGLLVARDYERAIELFKISAEQGNACAMEKVWKVCL
jgi:TPR repeat protein